MAKVSYFKGNKAETLRGDPRYRGFPVLALLVPRRLRGRYLLLGSIPNSAGPMVEVVFFSSVP